MSVLNQLTRAGGAAKARPVGKIVVYGPDGVGKSTFARAAPKPYFLDHDRKADVLKPTPPDHAQPKNLGEVFAVLDALAVEDHGYQTLVVDTIDFMEPLIWDDVIAEDREKRNEPTVRDIEDVGGGWNKGYTKAVPRWRAFLGKLDRLSDQRGMHVILLAHQRVVKTKDPHGGDYGRIGLAIHDGAGELIRGWAECVLRAMFEPVRVKRGKLQEPWKDYGQARWLLTTWHPAYDAKNNLGMGERVALDWSIVERHLLGRAPVDAELVATLEERIEMLPEEIQAKAKAAFNAALAANDRHRLTAILNQVTTDLESAVPTADYAEQEEAAPPQKAAKPKAEAAPKKAAPPKAPPESTADATDAKPPEDDPGVDPKLKFVRARALDLIGKLAKTYGESLDPEPKKGDEPKTGEALAAAAKAFVDRPAVWSNPSKLTAMVENLAAKLEQFRAAEETEPMDEEIEETVPAGAEDSDGFEDPFA